MKSAPGISEFHLHVSPALSKTPPWEQLGLPPLPDLRPTPLLMAPLTPAPASTSPTVSKAELPVEGLDLAESLRIPQRPLLTGPHISVVQNLRLVRAWQQHPLLTMASIWPGAPRPCCTGPTTLQNAQKLPSCLQASTGFHGNECILESPRRSQPLETSEWAQARDRHGTGTWLP